MNIHDASKIIEIERLYRFPINYRLAEFPLNSITNGFGRDLHRCCTHQKQCQDQLSNVFPCQRTEARTLKYGWNG